MSEGVTAIADTHTALLEETNQFTIAEDNRVPCTTDASQDKEHGLGHLPPVAASEDEAEEEDFVVYSESVPMRTVDDISRHFETQTGELTIKLETSKKETLPPERHEIRFQDEEGGTSLVSESTRLVEPQFTTAFPQEEAINSFQDVPLLNSNPDGLFFNGLVFCDTVDSLYRPVVVINTRAIPHKSLRSAALKHLREALEPVVSTGPYVLIFTSFAASSLSKLPVSWVVAAYRELSYPFRKNVQHVILVRPNKLLKALVRVMKLVVTKKAHSKIKQVLYMNDIESVTNGEVTIEHLSPKVVRALGPEELTYSDVSNTSA